MDGADMARASVGMTAYPRISQPIESNRGFMICLIAGLAVLGCKSKGMPRFPG
jgi:hypothetical protein